MNKQLSHLVRLGLFLGLFGLVSIVLAQNSAPTQISGGSWNLQNSYIALSSGTDIWIYDDAFRFVAQLDINRVEADGEVRVGHIRWSPDGSQLAVVVKFEGYVDNVYTFYDYMITWDTISWQSITTIDKLSSSSSLTWNPSNQEFAVLTGTYDAAIEIYDSTTGDLARTLNVGSTNVIGFDWNPVNLNEMAIATTDSLQLWNPITLQQDVILTVYNSDVPPKYNPQASQIAFLNSDLDVEVWDTGSRQLVRVIDTPQAGLAFGWVNDDLLTIEIDGTQRFWDVITGQSSIIPSETAFRIWKTDGSGYILVETDRILLLDAETGNIQSQLVLNTNLQVSSFTGIDRVTNNVITGLSPITTGDMIDLAQPSVNNLAIQANTNPNTVGSVVFDLNGTSVLQTDDAAPYDFTNWTPAVGAYTLTATPYSGAGGTGTAGTALAINFTIVDSGGTGGGPNQILFSSVTNPFTAATNIFVINPDGSGQTQLTTGNGIRNFPAWSPDGTQILYSSNQDGDDEIFVMNADGSNPVQLTTNTALDRFPVWSPDGTQIAFASRRDGNWEIYVMNADGTNPVNLTNNATDDFNVSWSPDGSQIAFASLRDAAISTDTEIYVMNADGTNVQRLTNSPSIDETPNWSPDGTQIAFTSDRSAGNIDIYVMNADGTNVQRLTSYSGTDEFPNWSPDGTQIAFDSNRSSFFNLYFDIHTMNADGTNVQRITTRDAFDRFAAWGYP
jgi:TolB protein